MNARVLVAVTTVIAVGLAVWGSTRPSARPGAKAAPKLSAQQMVSMLNPEASNIAILYDGRTQGGRVLISRYSNAGKRQVGLIYFEEPNRGGYEVSTSADSARPVLPIFLGGPVPDQPTRYWAGLVINNPSVAFVQLTGPHIVMRRAVQPGQRVVMIPVPTINHLHVMAVSSAGQCMT
jgi:hypothetical protein